MIKWLTATKASIADTLQKRVWRRYANKETVAVVDTVTTWDSIRFGHTTIEYEVRRSERRKKTVQITVDGGSVQVVAPLATPDRELRAIVRKRAAWILSHATKATPQAAPKGFVSGETLPYLGRNVRMIIEPADVPSTEVRFDHWRFRVAVPRSLDGGERYEAIRRSIVEWYRSRAVERLTSGVDRWWSRLGEGEKSRILIRDQKRRWGSCAHDGTLRFNWRVMMLEASLIEYIIVHELVHLRVKNHSADFWRSVAEVLPDMEHRRRRLREAGRTLPF